MNNSEKIIQEFTSLTEGIVNSQRKGVGLSMGAEEQSLLAFDLEQRFAIAEARVMVPAGPQQAMQKQVKTKKPQMQAGGLTAKQKEIAEREARRKKR